MQVSFELLGRCVGEGFYGRLLQTTVHPLSFAIRPRMLDLGSPMFNAVLPANTVKNMFKRVNMVRMVGELAPIVRQHFVDFVGHCPDETT